MIQSCKTCANFVVEIPPRNNRGKCVATSRGDGDVRSIHLHTAIWRTECRYFKKKPCNLLAAEILAGVWDDVEHLPA